jgi:hypothetical protein
MIKQAQSKLINGSADTTIQRYADRSTDSDELVNTVRATVIHVQTETDVEKKPRLPSHI